MDPADLHQLIPGFIDKSHAEKIKIFGWYLHVHKGMASFKGADIKKCYDTLHFPAPSSFGGYFSNLVISKELLKNASGYRLSASAREKTDALYGNKGYTVKITSLLLKLPEKIPDLTERTYLNEALDCYTARAFRAAIVMTWNLAYYHLCDFILKKHLTAFNARWQISFPGHHRRAMLSISKMDDFGDKLKESEVLTIAKDGNIISKDVCKILSDKLGKRNSAAHPSSVKIEQLQTDDFIDDLVKNVVLKLL